jgi:TRAP-type C4-dicarboxylate transport system permease small subunit
MNSALKKLTIISDKFLGIIGFVGILVITANAFCRFVLHVSMAWSDELLRTIMIYGYFIGAAVMYSQGGCMRLEIIDSALKNKGKSYNILNVILEGINVAFFGLMSYYVLSMVIQYLQDGTTQSTSSTPAWILPFGCAIGMVVIAIVAVRNIIKHVSVISKKS